MPDFFVYNDEVRKFSMRLQTMHKSDFPIAVRSTLNDLAFDTKKFTLTTEFKEQFIQRNRTFIKSQSGVQKALGFNVNQMFSQVGIYPKGSGEKSAEELTLQEFGGSKRKPVIYMKQARGGSNKKLVQQSKYFHKQKMIREGAARRRSEKSSFIAAAIMAHRLGLLLRWKSRSGETIYQINSVYLGTGNTVKVNAVPIASYLPAREISISRRPFMLPASERSMLKVNAFFIQNAKKRFEKGK